MTSISIQAGRMDRYLGVNFEGSEPSGKKYFMEVVKPEGYKVQKYQYIIWKILRDKGYERTNYDNADIIIKADYHEYIFNPSMGSVTNGKKIVDLDLYAYPKSYNEETIPYWKISMQKGGQITMHFLYFMDWFWFQQGFHFVEYRETYKKTYDNDWKIAKFKDDRTKYKASDEDIEKLNLRIRYLNDDGDIGLFNEQNH